MAVTLQQFTERLVQSGLVSAEELGAFQEGLPPEKKPQDAQGLARELILADRLTRFQAEAVYRGKLRGLVMGEYVVLDRIGAGGMGEVLKARHRRMDRVVALKVLPRKAMRSEDAVKRFYREVQAAARLIHPNIVTAFDASECEGIHYLVMEYVDGQDLAHVVKQHGPMSVDAAIECIVQAARGLEYAHKQGIIHRDIKPGNLLLDRDGTVKILDMGLARIDIAGADEPERLTASEQVMGTCDYMAPEQAEDTHAADHRADVYSLGCTFYRLLTGTPPYQGDSLIKILLAHREAPIPSLCEARADVPEAVDAVYHKMLAKRPEDRYPSMGEVVEALEACRQSEGAGDKVAAEAPSDSALTTFLDKLAIGGGTTGTKQRAATIAEETRPSVAPEEETGKGVVGKLLSADRRTLVRYLGIGGGVAVCVVLFGLLVAVLNRDGREKGKGETAVTQEDGKKGRPPLAVAPFDSPRAKWYQQQWGNYLGLPVEWENSIGMKFVLIPPGEFMMGSPDAERQWALEEAKAANDWRRIESIPTEAPRHSVKITRPFYLGKFEATQGQWEAVIGNNPSELKGSGNPVNNVSWNDVQRFLAMLNTRGTRRVVFTEPPEAPFQTNYALPTEAEWEYACRAGTTRAFCFGDEVALLGEYAWFQSNSDGKTQPVGRRRPNAWGLYDTHGNVWEWCMDWWAPDYYAHSRTLDPPGPLASSDHVVRGGDWGDGPRACRAASRYHVPPTYLGHNLGFRVVCQIPTDPAELAKFAAAIKATKPLKDESRPEAASGKPEEGLAPEDDARWGPWEDLFDGKSLDGWEVPRDGQYANPRKVAVEEGVLVLEPAPGNSFAAIRYTRPVPKSDYEVAVEARRMNGDGDFGSLVFPVGDTWLSLWVGGGVGGRTVGLCMVDGLRPPKSPGTMQMEFERGRWYRVRVRVTPEQVAAWIDDRQVADQPLEGHTFELDEWSAPTRPFGVRAWMSKAEVRSIRLRRLRPAPPLAVAPFDASQAKQHQKAWADYLGLPVEREVELPGGVKLTMVLIPPGEFTMGSPEAERQRPLKEARAAGDAGAIDRIPTEAPQHRVKITRPFYLGKYEVTQAQWEAVMGSNPSSFQGPANPVEQVSWEDIQSFLVKLNATGARRVPSAKPGRAATKMKYALPTEAQWECACRAGTTTAFCFSDDATMLGHYGWFASNSGSKRRPVGALKPNAWGLYDMHGNVWEWCADWWGMDYYAQSPPSDPPGPVAGSYRVRRGGSLHDPPGYCRSAHRGNRTPGHRYDSLGFRLALVPADE